MQSQQEDKEHQYMDGNMPDEEETDEFESRVPQIVHQFFEQSSDQRFNYLQGLKQLLTKQLEKKFEYTKNSLLPEEAQQAIKQERNENEQEEDEESDLLMNLPPELIEMVLQFIFKIYSAEFEEKKNECETEEQKNNLKTEDVFDEYDHQAIDELTDFIREYSQYKTEMQDQLNRIQQQLSQVEGYDQLGQQQMEGMEQFNQNGEEGPN